LVSVHCDRPAASAAGVALTGGPSHTMSRALSRGLQLARPHGATSASLTNSLGAAYQQCRGEAGKVAEFYGKPSDYTPGTEFLGTPKDHRERLKKRPVSPHVFEIDGKGFHYKMPINAVSSITNRATGVALTGAISGAGLIALTGDLPGTIDYIKAASPAFTVLLKAGVSFPLIYHYLAGLRHVVWEHAKIGKQADKTSLLENETVDKSSKAIFVASVAGTLALAVTSF